jgi:hypothetical protein
MDDRKVPQESVQAPAATPKGQENAAITGSEKKQEGHENMTSGSGSVIADQAQLSHAAENSISDSKQQASDGDHLTESAEADGYQFTMLDVSQVITSAFFKHF